MDRALVHATTYGGNNLAMVAGLATLSVIDDEGLVANAERAGAALRGGLTSLAEQYQLISDVRGRGLMIGIEFGRPRSARLRGGWDVLHAARTGLFSQAVVGALYHRHGILTQVASDHAEVVKLLPPLMIGSDEVAYFLDAFADVMADAHRARGLVFDFGRTVVAQALNRRSP
jgi:4-aminobutyrate aminotransferase-like enzyme